MIKQGFTYQQKLPVVKLTFVLIAISSIMFPSIYALISGKQGILSLSADILITFMVQAILAFLIYSVVKVFNAMLFPEINRWWRYFPELLVILFISYLFLHYLHVAIRDEQYQMSPENESIDYRLYISINLVGSGFIYMLVTSFNLYQLMIEKTAQAEKLQKEYAHVRLQALKSQVNPHFLFNSLSVLSSLVHVSPDLSEKFIVQLSKAYRYILEQKDSGLVSLKSELEFLDAYFFLMEIRFDNKIVLEKQEKPDSEEWMLPPLTLQLLVENALKHNRMSSAEPLWISIQYQGDRMTVRNNLNKRDESVASTGIGLDNIQKRLSFVTDKPMIVKADEHYFEVSIPLTRKITEHIS
ncbi:MAG TPA: histidine kinase [Chitinophagaceae bacterium]|nr:histidine kinase [Chitinophagaceae bacterium]HRF25781.1 histidine kinase [Ferruginibacter sp.]